MKFFRMRSVNIDGTDASATAGAARSNLLFSKDKNELKTPG